MNKKKKKNVKKKKIRYGRVLIFLSILLFIIVSIINFLNKSIRSIFIDNNVILSDQEIIDMAGLSNYPSMIDVNPRKIKSKLEKNIYIKKAKVKKNRYREVEIKVEENIPIVYDSSSGKTIFLDGKKQSGMLEVPVLINYVPDTVYSKFLKKLGNLDYEALNKISEIKYDPGNVDEERFLLLMIDGNYVYITLDKLRKINKYTSIMEQVLGKYSNQNGILYLDEGEYFQVFNQ